MTIQLKQSIQIAGIHQPIGTTLTLGIDVEAELVNRGVAVYVGANPAVGGAVPAESGALPMPANRILLFGNSITADNYSAPDATQTYYQARGYFTWANAFLKKKRMNIIRNSGVVNDTTAQMLARLQSDVLAYRPPWVGLACMANNDINTGVSDATTKANLSSIFGRIRDSGTNIILLNDISRNAFTAAQRARVFEQNRWYQSLAAADRGFILADAFGANIDPLSATVQAKTNHLRDGTHHSLLGAFYAGQAFANAVSPFLAESIFPVESIKDNYGYDASIRQLNDYGLFQGAGPVADGWTGAVTGSAGATWSLVAAASGVGNAQRGVITSAAANDTATLTLTTSVHSRVARGDTVYVEVDVDVSTLTNCRGIFLDCLINAGAYLSRDMHLASDAGVPQLNWSGKLRTPPFVLPVAPTALVQKMTMYFNGVGGGTFEFANASIVKA